MALFYAQSKLVSPSGRDVAQRQRGLAPSYAQSKLVSPSGRDVAQRQRGLIPASMFLKVYPDTNLSASYPLSHLLRKCQLSRRESQEAGANCNPDKSSYLLRRPARVLLLPSRLAPRHLPQRGRHKFLSIVIRRILAILSTRASASAARAARGILLFFR